MFSLFNNLGRSRGSLTIDAALIDVKSINVLSPIQAFVILYEGGAEQSFKKNRAAGSG